MVQANPLRACDVIRVWYPELYKHGRYWGGCLHVAQRFERLLDAHRRQDGSRWSGHQLDEATDGVVARSYVTNFRKGLVESPATRRCGR